MMYIFLASFTKEPDYRIILFFFPPFRAESNLNYTLTSLSSARFIHFVPYFRPNCRILRHSAGDLNMRKSFKEITHPSPHFISWLGCIYHCSAAHFGSGKICSPNTQHVQLTSDFKSVECIYLFIFNEQNYLADYTKISHVQFQVSVFTKYLSFRKLMEKYLSMIQRSLPIPTVLCISAPKLWSVSYLQDPYCHCSCRNINIH